MNSRLVVCALAFFVVALGNGHVRAQTPSAEAELQPVLRELGAGGGRTVQDLDPVRDDVLVALRRCRALAVRAGVATDSRLRVSVDAAGRVTSATVLAEGSVSAAARRWHRCATRAVSRLRLAAGAAGTLEFSVRWAVPPLGALSPLVGDVDPAFGFGGLGLRGSGPGAGEGTGAPSTGGPRIRTDAATVRGSLSREVILSVVRRHLNEVRYCYERALATTPTLAGRLEVTFVISPSGAISAAGIASDTLGSPEVAACVESAVRRWTFPTPEGGGVVQVRYPFVFSAGEPAPTPSE